MYHSPNKGGLNESSPGKFESTEVSTLANNEHRTHNGWLKKIHALWDQIDAQRSYHEVLRVEADIIQKEWKLKSLKNENMQENARCLALQIKFIDKARKRLKNMPLISKTEKKMIKV